MDTNVLLKRLQALSDENAEIRKENAEMRKQNSKLIKKDRETNRSNQGIPYPQTTWLFIRFIHLLYRVQKRKKTRTKKQSGKKSDILLQNRYKNLDQEFDMSDGKATPVNDPEVIKMSEPGENTP